MYILAAVDPWSRCARKLSEDLRGRRDVTVHPFLPAARDSSWISGFDISPFGQRAWIDNYARLIQANAPK